MTTKSYRMPPGQPLMKAGQSEVEITPQFYRYLEGLEDVSKRVAEYQDPDTVTLAQLTQALIDANIMKSS